MYVHVHTCGNIGTYIATEHLVLYTSSLPHAIVQGLRMSATLLDTDEMSKVRCIHLRTVEHLATVAVVSLS